MPQRGVNPKAWFYRLKASLNSTDNVLCLLGGAACEQWINGELFRAVAAHLEGTTLTAYPEWNRRQHDIAILKFKPEERGMWHQPVAIIECKVVYNDYSATKRESYVDRLVEQLLVDHEPNPKRVGFLFGIHAVWHDYRRRPPKENFDSYRRSLGNLFRTKMRAHLHEPAPTVDHKGSLETVLERRCVRIGAASVEVGCVGQYFVLGGP
jgi:hypothetical protein